VIAVCIEQTAERARKEATGSGQHAGLVKDTEEQRKVNYSSVKPLICSSFYIFTVKSYVKYK